MLFRTHQSWENKSSITKAIVGKNSKVFSIVELSVNTVFFILEIEVANNGNGSENSSWRSFLVESIDQALFMINDTNTTNHRASLFLPRNLSENFEYTINTIKEVHVAEDSYGDQSYLFICNNGFRHIVGNLGTNENQLINSDCVYKRTNF